MRLDKFLKVSRIIKRRTVANEVCDAKHVNVNGKPARASYDVKEGDVVCIVRHQGNEVVTVDQISRTAKTINNETLTSISSRVPRLKVRS